MNKQTWFTPKRPQPNTNEPDKIEPVKIEPVKIEDKSTSPLLKKLPLHLRYSTSSGNTKKAPRVENYHIRICLEAIHYSGKDFGNGWTFIISTLKHHWISNRIQIMRGTKSLVNKDIYNDITSITLEDLQHLGVTIYAQHHKGFNIETTLHLQPNFFKRSVTPKSIYTNIDKVNEKYNVREIQTVKCENTQLMFVLNFEITPNIAH